MSKRRSKKRRTAAQRAATAKMLRHNKRGKRHMAKRRRKRVAAPRRRRSSRRRGGGHRVHHRRRRRGMFGGGGGGGISAVKADLPQMVIGAIYGKVESLAAGDANFVLNRVPRPIAVLGYTGNIAAMLYVASMFTRNHYVRQGARVVATIAAYKLGKQGKLYASSDVATIGDVGSSAFGDELEGDERIIDANVMGALDAEAREFGGGHNESQGIPYDAVVREAGSRV